MNKIRKANQEIADFISTLPIMPLISLCNYQEELNDFNAIKQGYERLSASWSAFHQGKEEPLIEWENEGILKQWIYRSTRADLQSKNALWSLCQVSFYKAKSCATTSNNKWFFECKEPIDLFKKILEEESKILVQRSISNPKQGFSRTQLKRFESKSNKSIEILLKLLKPKLKKNEREKIYQDYKRLLTVATREWRSLSKHLYYQPNRWENYLWTVALDESLHRPKGVIASDFRSWLEFLIKQKEVALEGCTLHTQDNQYLFRETLKTQGVELLFG